MPRSTRLSSAALLPVDDNIRITPVTPGKKVKELKAELEKKDVENDTLRNNIADLTNALNNLNLVKDKIETKEVQGDTKKTKKGKDAPLPAKTAYKFFCEGNQATKPDGVDMRQLWKDLNPEVRPKYTVLAEVDKARYQGELAKYNQEKVALEMFYETKKQDMAMEFFDAHVAAQTALEKTEADKKKGKKSKKDPDAPKRPTSSYMYFAMDKRESVTKSNPGAKPTEITKILGEMWNKLDKGKRGKNGTQKYDKKGEVDRARYEEEKAEYDELIKKRNSEYEKEKLDRLAQDKVDAMKLMESFQTASDKITAENKSMLASSVSAPVITKKKKKKDPNAPKKNSSAYIFFCKENRETIKSNMQATATQSEILTEVGRQWKVLSDKKKAKFIKLADEDKKRYAKEMEEYNAGK